MSLSPASLLRALEPWLQAPRWWLGLSGGLDSTALLHLVAELRSEIAVPPLTAVHVDHQLSAAAPDWDAHCRQLCDELGVELESRQVSVVPDGAGPEAAARNARYHVFEELVGEGELLLLAHHRDDQVETFFLRLMRGAGTLGLGGMPGQRALGRGRLLRPLLSWQRSDIEDYARRCQLRWVEDDSNADLSLDRNYLRHSVLPLLEQRWPGYRRSIELGMQAVLDAESDLTRHYSRDLASARGMYFGEQVLDLQALGKFDAAALCRLLRLWLAGEGIAVPGRSQLEELARQLCTAGPQAQPLLKIGDYQLQRYRHLLHLRPTLELPTEAQCVELHPGQVLDLPGLGQLEMRPEREGGLREPEAGFWRVELRRGGERCRPAGRAHSRSLKKLLQEYRVPPWWRDRLPLLYDGTELAAVADLWVCEGFQVNPGERGYYLRWK